MLSSKKKSALAKYIVSLHRMQVAKVLISLKWLPESSEDLGYTYREKNHAVIHVNPNQHGKLSMYFDGLSDDEASLFIVGVGVHEIMHQILTNFVLFSKMHSAYANGREKKLFSTVFNIFEDSRIESFAPSYFSGEALAALNYSIKHIWEVSPDIDPTQPVIIQVLDAMIQYGDLGDVKPELSDEAQEVFDKIALLFNDAINATSCAVCLTKAKEAVKILLPYAEEIPEEALGDDDGSRSDSTGEDAIDSEASKKSRSRKTKRKSGTGSDKSGDKSSSGGDSEEDDKTDDEGASKASDDKESKDDSDSEESDPDASLGDDGEGDIACEGDSMYLDGAEKAEMTSFDSDPDEVDDDSEASEEDFKRAMDDLSDTLSRYEKAEESASFAESSDYDFAPTENPTADKFVKTISHHKASPDPEAYEEYLNIVSSDAHELAKIIKRQFKTKPGRVKRADHGNLNLMRYKDPNFRSPLIFDRKKPKEKHCAAVMLLVDESGSMYGNRISNARLAAIMLAEALAEANVPCCVVGHSGDYKYSYSVELEHYTTFKNTPADRTSMAMITARQQNRDGPAIRWATSILKKRHEKNKLMIVISDGQPCADSYSGEDAIFDTKSAIREAKRNHDIVGIVLEAGSATQILTTMYGNDYIVCDSAKNLKDCIAKIITSKCKDW